jgi:indolepyruvate ferredoxin oxidoreductase beta subunit
MTDPANVLLVGVGGQGIVLAGDLLANAALLDGFDVKKSEIHGMSQRGGSVTSHVRFGGAVFSPVIPDGHADLLLAFERLEAMRYAAMLRRGGRAIVCDRRILPAPVLSGAADYPEGLEAVFEANDSPLSLLDGESLASAAGNSLAVNVVLLGAASRHLPLSEDAWERALEAGIKPAYREINRNAFRRGREAV